MTRYLKAKIIRWVSDDPPGFVECQFKDAFGRNWSIIEKDPVVTNADIWPNRTFPQPAWIACEICSLSLDSGGGEIAEITTKRPWAIEAADGTDVFRVFAAQLVESMEVTPEATLKNE